jgi:phosphate transport system permease protein
MTEALRKNRWATPEMRASLRKRQRAERGFRWLGILALSVALGSLSLLIGSLVSGGAGAFMGTEIRLDVDLDPTAFDLSTESSEPERRERIAGADYRALVRTSLRERFPDVTGRREKRDLGSLLSRGAGAALRAQVSSDSTEIGKTLSVWLPADDEVDLFRKSGGESTERLGDQKAAWIAQLESEGRVRTSLNLRFLTSGDSREPELAGIWGALMGSFWTLLVTLALVMPLGVASAVYLEEFAPRNRLTDLIEVNINNLAAVPSIVFGLLGLAFFLGVLNLPRSAPLVGGLTLALMTLPTIIITARVAIQAVPPSIRDAALGVGASPLQVVGHHVLPIAMPGILTGTIIGMARALGETAPLLMIGMVAFVVDVPGSFTDAATALPVQIFLWANSPERAFVEKTSGAILVLLAFLILMNATAIGLRRRFEKRW